MVSYMFLYQQVDLKIGLLNWLVESSWNWSKLIMFVISNINTFLIRMRIHYCPISYIWEDLWTFKSTQRSKWVSTGSQPVKFKPVVQHYSHTYTIFIVAKYKTSEMSSEYFEELSKTEPGSFIWKCHSLKWKLSFRAQVSDTCGNIFDWKCSTLH